MTYTNGKPQDKHTLEAMLKVIYELDRQNNKTQTEFKIHPDDFAALRMQLEPSMITNASLNTPPEFFGLKLVVDFSAERLPTKAAKTQGWNHIPVEPDDL